LRRIGHPENARGIVEAATIERVRKPVMSAADICYLKELATDYIAALIYPWRYLHERDMEPVPRPACVIKFGVKRGHALSSMLQANGLAG
jgi:hypothetical protein